MKESSVAVAEGCGWIQRENSSIEKVCAGDVAISAPNEKHWHGATATIPMTHVAMSEGGVQWLEQVSDREYAGGPE